MPPDPFQRIMRCAESVPAAVAARLAMAAVGVLVFLLGGGPRSGGLVVALVALIWVATSTTLTLRSVARGADVPRAVGVRTALVDAAFVAALVATTGGVESQLRWLLIAAPAVWAYAEQRRMPALVAAGVVAFLIASIPDVVHGRPDVVGDIGRFLGIYAGATGIAVATIVAGEHREALELEVARTRGELLQEMVRHERRQQEDLSVRIHDGPLQMLLAARQDLEEHVEGEPIDLEQTLETLSQAADGLRDLNTDLYDAVLRDAGLAAALGQAAQATERNGGPPIDVSVGAHTAGVHDTIVVSIVNELLTNVRKHAHAQSASVLVTRSESGRLDVAVRDDGVGVDHSAVQRASDQGHIGLRSIQHRIEQAGGSFEVRDLEHGTEIAFALPADADVVPLELWPETSQEAEGTR